MAKTIVERDEELNLLKSMFADALHHKGSVAAISGVVASGKTELLHSFADHVTQSGALFLSAAGSRAEHTLPLGVVRQLFRSAAPSSGSAEGMARLLDEGALAPALSDCESETTGRATAQVLHGLCVALLNLADETPVVIGVDDVQYADIASLQCILYLVRRMRSSRLMVVLNEGPVGNPPFHADLLAQPHCRRITLSPLSRDGVGRLLAAHLSQPAARQLTDVCHRLTGGNPLLVRALIEDNAASASTGPAGHPVVGDAFGQAVLRCLYRATPAVLGAARALAVLGDVGSPAVLAGLLEIEPAAATQAITALTTAGLLENGRFRHPIARAAVLKNVTADERAAMHRRSAQLLYGMAAPPTAVARHLVAGGPLDDWWVIPVLQEAAERAVLDGEPEFAVECLERAQDMCTDPAQRTALAVLLARAQWRINPVTASRHLPAALDAVRDGRLTGRLAALALKHLLWSGRVADVSDVLDRLGNRDGEADLDIAAGLNAAKPWLAYSSPSLLARLPQMLRNATPAARAGSGPRAGELLAAAMRDGADNALVKGAEQVLRKSRPADTTMESILAALATLVYMDRPDRAAAWCDTLSGQDGAEDAVYNLAPTWQALFAALRAEAAVRQGNLPAAEKYARAALTEISPQSWGVAIGAPLSTLLIASVDMGKHKEAGDQLSQPVPETLLQTTFGVHYLYARGRYALAADLPHAALGDFRACGELMATWGITSPAVVPWRTDAALALLRLGDHRKARELVQRQLQSVRGSYPRTHGAALRVLALTTELRQRRQLLQKAVEVLQKSGDRLELARALADLGQAHYALGDSNLARLVVRRAHSLAQDCHAEPLRQALQATPAEPAVDATVLVEADGVPPLSEAERRVAVLAAQGHTNREIARRLYITISTVEQHLTRIYRKLNVNRRTDLPIGLQLDLVGD